MSQSQLDLRLLESDNRAVAAASLTTGFSALDLHLPENGWPRNNITEIFYDGPASSTVRLLLPTLAQLSLHNRWLAWIAPPSLPYRAQFRAAGINLQRALIIRPHPHNNGLWAVEQALRSGTCAAVLSWVNEADQDSIEKLKDAANAGGSCGLLFRPSRTLDQTQTSHLRLLIRNDGNSIFVRVLGLDSDNDLELSFMARHLTLSR